MSIQFKTIDKDNFLSFKELVIQQAKAHDTLYKGNDHDFIAVLEDQNTPVNAVAAYNPDDNAYLGYILYMVSDTLHGKEIYLEDLIVDEKARGQGIASDLFKQLKSIARDENADSVAWCVDSENIPAQKFYTQRQSAMVHSNKVYYDVPLSLTHDFNAANDNKTLQIITLDNDNIDKYLHSLAATTAQRAIDICRNDNAEILMAVDQDHNPVSAIIAHPNFSSFQTRFGWHIDLIDTNTQHDPSLIADGYTALFKAAATRLTTDNDCNHIYTTIDSDSLSQVEFSARNKLQPLALTSHPNSKAIACSLPQKEFLNPEPQ